MDNIEIVRYTGGTIASLIDLVKKLNVMILKCEGTWDCIDASILSEGDTFVLFSNGNLAYKSADGTKLIVVFMNEDPLEREKTVKELRESGIPPNRK